ncbi:hypothetical protein CXZ10_16900 [Pleomorphomonas diazotrophica]|uniref:HEPN domain-containing protein n=1 Tax=Pleomorphomonas diazotrophica TaxID=1166257 RepID=A0A1I4RQS4_9HYPH|nr:hypothetical protein [Pleomorphomonas diazotrophica]PKR88127.1 hypothetical protein CXZ10_16900 [Pleomorphomonas diazotrophica]SFM54320.1 hypothetical protein SAMN05192571_102163 [Pleomorphomonas diazotrophica]
MPDIDFEFTRERDRELTEAGLTLHQRPFHVAIAWMKANNISGPLFDNTIWSPLMTFYRQLYPSGDFSVPALFEGGVAFRDQMYSVRVDVGFGQFSIEPIKCIEIPPEELETIYNLERDQFWGALYCAGDVIDIAYGIDDISHQRGEAARLFSNARSALAATVRTLQGRLDLDTAVQSACIASELALKGALVCIGWTLPQVRKLSHNLVEAAETLVSERPRSSDAQLLAACASFPNYVTSRYTDHGLSRRELMTLAMRSQFIVAEAVRRVTERDLGAQLEADQSIPPRVLP